MHVLSNFNKERIERACNTVTEGISDISYVSHTYIVSKMYNILHNYIYMYIFNSSSSSLAAHLFSTAISRSFFPTQSVVYQYSTSFFTLLASSLEKIESSDRSYSMHGICSILPSIFGTSWEPGTLVSPQAFILSLNNTLYFVGVILLVSGVPW